MGKRTALLIGNSDGIGLAFTRHLIREGWSVTGVSRSGLDEGEIAGAHGDYRHTVCNVLDPKYKQALREAWAERGPFDLVVHLVGIGFGLERGEFDREAETFRANLVSLVETVEVMMPKLIAANSGHLMGLSSIADDILMPDAPSYCASKAGYSSYLNSLALRYK
ncbi:MAG: NAD(P)-dependent dehydrogenase (short-subunit alcohol dehydrogenase family), partial [Planctomycetota bacterium]